MARRRETNIFSLSFLDVMSCGFGAVVLIFLIINHATEKEAAVVNQDLLAEIRLLDYQVQNGEKDLVELQGATRGTAATGARTRMPDSTTRKPSIDDELGRSRGGAKPSHLPV